MRTKAYIWRGVTSLLAVILSFSLLMTNLLMSWSGQVNVFFDITPPTVQADENSMIYKSEYGLSDKGLKEMLAASDKHDIQTMEEGAVLLTNKEAALPLKNEERSVTLFGRASADPVYSGNSGGPSIDEARQINLYQALSDVGFKINDTLYKAYESSETKRAKAEPDWFIGEEEQSFYNEKIKASYQADYNDVAIVTFARDGGEGKDLATVDRDGVSFLALHETEKDLLRMIEESGVFSKTIVLINSAYPMELEWIDETEYGVDGALWIGATGLIGFAGIANILIGEVDPSGRTVDTFATDSLSAPAVQNAGDFTYANDEANYIIQAEGIYLGYKYYETRYHDSILNLNNANSKAGTFASQADKWDYADEMVYPFGFGKSYAEFTQEVKNITWDREKKEVKAIVNVTNNGVSEDSTYSGKSRSVVQLYAHLPYEKGQAEKSAIQLIGFEKTKLLGAGESQEVTITVDDYLFATYDEKAVNGADTSKKGAYVFDPGDYYFAVGDNSHDALNHVLLAKQGDKVKNQLVEPNNQPAEADVNKAVLVKVDELDNITHASSKETGEVVSNQFTEIDINYFNNNEVTYLTRSNWETYPKSYKDIKASDEMLELMYHNEYEKPSDAPAYDSFKQEEDVTLKLIDMKDVPFDDDDTWNKFLNQLSLSELSAMVGENFGQPAVKSVAKPANKNTDGPAGAQSSYLYGNKAPSTLHVSEIIATATWSKELIAERGDFIAEDCLFTGTMQLWSPGGNLHRTPFSGRNFEYYSEDSIMSYIMGAVQTEAMQTKGLTAAIKHFAANDQETNREGLSTFMTEQTYRQGALKGFEGAFTEGGALGTMLSFARIGPEIMYRNAPTLTTVLRGEWGFEGVTITDSVKGNPDLPTIESLVAGTDTFNADTGRGTEVQKYIVANKDGYVLEQLRQANKRFYYSVVNSNLMNGLSKDVEIKDFTPWWQLALYGINGVLGIGLIISMTVFFRKNKQRKKEVSNHV